MYKACTEDVIFVKCYNYEKLGCNLTKSNNTFQNILWLNILPSDNSNYYTSHKLPDYIYKAFWSKCWWLPGFSRGYFGCTGDRFFLHFQIPSLINYFFLAINDKTREQCLNSLLNFSSRSQYLRVSRLK